MQWLDIFQDSSVGENLHSITVTPVSLSTSTANMTPNSSAENSKPNKLDNSSKSDHQIKKAGNKTSKGFKRSEHKSRMSLMHFNRKPESSSDEDTDCGANCAPQNAGGKEQRLQAITFAAEEEHSRLSFRDPLPSVEFASHHCVVVSEKSKNEKDENSKKRKQKVAQSQSDWIWWGLPAPTNATKIKIYYYKLF